VIEITGRAAEVLSRSAAAARRFDPNARVRVVSDGSGVSFELTDRVQPTDREIEQEGFVLLVEWGLDGTIDVADHDRLVLVRSVPPDEPGP
jgi:hypothetical protein